MRIFINEYTKVAAYAFLGIIFSYASFYLIANIYHYQEIHKEVAVNISDIDSYQNIKKNLIKVSNNNKTNISSYNGSVDSMRMLEFKSMLDSCYTTMNNEEFKSLENKVKLNIKDVENFRQVVINNVINDCLVEQLYHFTSEDINISFLEKDKKYLKLQIDSLNKRMNIINRQLNNNSSFYFNTEFATKNVYNDVDEQFKYLLDVYEDSSNVLLEVSNKYENEVSSNV